MLSVLNIVFSKYKYSRDYDVIFLHYDVTSDVDKLQEMSLEN